MRGKFLNRTYNRRDYISVSHCAAAPRRPPAFIMFSNLYSFFFCLSRILRKLLKIKQILFVLCKYEMRMDKKTLISIIF